MNSTMSDQHIFEIQKAKQLLLFFGVRHSRNPNDEQWNVLNEEWNTFLQKAESKKVIFFEGPRFDAPHKLLFDDQIRKYGEAGFLLSLIDNKNITLCWPEILKNDELKELSREFKKELVEYFIFARTAGSILRDNIHDFDYALRCAAQSTAQAIGSSEGVSHYSVIHESIFGRPLIEKETDAIIRATAPIYTDSIVNEIGRESNIIRENRLVSEIHRYWADGYSIFVLFGSHHAKSLESRLREELL